MSFRLTINMGKYYPTYRKDNYRKSDILQVFNMWDVECRYKLCAVSCRKAWTSDKIDMIYRLISYRYNLTRR